MHRVAYYPMTTIGLCHINKCDKPMAGTVFGWTREKGSHGSGSDALYLNICDGHFSLLKAGILMKPIILKVADWGEDDGQRELFKVVKLHKGFSFRKFKKVHMAIPL
jgi:hypothetical protein